MIYLFTHTDLDGVGCAILAKLFFAGEPCITYCDYGDIDHKVKTLLGNAEILQPEDKIFITDISISKELAKKIEASSLECGIKLFDHHATAEPLNKFPWCKVRTTDEEDNDLTCGTKMFYDYLVHQYGNLYKDSLCDFVDFIRQWDTWEWKNTGDQGRIAKYLNDLLDIRGRYDFINHFVYQFQTEGYCYLDDTDKMLLEIRQREIKEYIQKKSRQMLNPHIAAYSVGIVFADRFISELGNQLCELHPEIDFVAIIDIANQKVSYRTIRDDINLGVFAQHYGGGGHPKAAGSQFTEDVLRNTVEKIFNH